MNFVGPGIPPWLKEPRQYGHRLCHNRLHPEQSSATSVRQPKPPRANVKFARILHQGFLHCYKIDKVGVWTRHPKWSCEAHWKISCEAHRKTHLAAAKSLFKDYWIRLNPWSRRTVARSPGIVRSAKHCRLSSWTGNEKSPAARWDGKNGNAIDHIPNMSKQISVWVSWGLCLQTWHYLAAIPGTHHAGLIQTLSPN